MSNKPKYAKGEILTVMHPIGSDAEEVRSQEVTIVAVHQGTKPDGSDHAYNADTKDGTRMLFMEIELEPALPGSKLSRTKSDGVKLEVPALPVTRDNQPELTETTEIQVVVHGELYELAAYSDPYSDGSRNAVLRRVER